MSDTLKMIEEFLELETKSNEQAQKALFSGHPCGGQIAKNIKDKFVDKNIELAPRLALALKEAVSELQETKYYLNYQTILDQREKCLTRISAILRGENE